jgi:hypothetical protein
MTNFVHYFSPLNTLEEREWSGSVHQTNGPGSGRPKNYGSGSLIISVENWLTWNCVFQGWHKHHPLEEVVWIPSRQVDSLSRVRGYNFTKKCRLSWRIWAQMLGEGWELRGLSQWVQLYTGGTQINFGDLTPYLTYEEGGRNHPARKVRGS